MFWFLQEERHLATGLGSRTNEIRTVSQLCRSAPQREIRYLDGNRCTPQNDPHRTSGHRQDEKIGQHCWLTLHISTLWRAVPPYASIPSNLSIRLGRKKGRTRRSPA